VEKERKSEEVAHVASLQKVQQERLAYSLWTKAQEYSGIQGMPPRSATLEQRG